MMESPLGNNELVLPQKKLGMAKYTFTSSACWKSTTSHFSTTPGLWVGYVKEFCFPAIGSPDKLCCHLIQIRLPYQTTLTHQVRVKRRKALNECGLQIFWLEGNKIAFIEFSYCNPRYTLNTIPLTHASPNWIFTFWGGFFLYRSYWYLVERKG